MTITIAREEDIPRLRDIYLDAVTTIGPARYSPAQVQAWVQFVDGIKEFRNFILDGTTFVAEVDETPVGFCGIADDGHVLSVYVRGSCARQGVGSMLLAQALEHGKRNSISEFYAEASAFSLPLFRKFGFLITGKERVVQYGAEFERYLVSTASP